MRKLTVRQVVNLFKRNVVEDEVNILEKFHLTLTHIHSGAFRRVYKIEGLPLAVKIPIDGTDENIEHSADEMKAIARIQTDPKAKHLRKYLPKVHHYNKWSGVILMKAYRSFNEKPIGRTLERKIDAMSNDVIEYFGLDEGDHDIWYGNATIDKGQPIILDLGILLGGING
jgi:hypothetical protein